MSGWAVRLQVVGAVCLITAGAATARGQQGEVTGGDERVEPQTSGSEGQAPLPTYGFSRRRTQRSVNELLPGERCVPPRACAQERHAPETKTESLVEIDPIQWRPRWMQPRSPVVASLLGFGLGFGTGFFYSHDQPQGIAFAAADTALWAGFAGTWAGFNQLVTRNDLRTGRSLALGERSFGHRESNLYAVSWILLAVAGASRVYQGIASIFAARATNASLDQLMVVPLGPAAPHP